MGSRNKHHCRSLSSVVKRARRRPNSDMPAREHERVGGCRTPNVSKRKSAAGAGNGTILWRLERIFRWNRYSPDLLEPRSQQFGEGNMSEIMTMCSVTNRSIPTGLTTNSVIFESLPDINLPIRCPRCGRQHVWSRRKAWVARSEPSSHQVLQFDQVLRRA